MSLFRYLAFAFIATLFAVSNTRAESTTEVEGATTVDVITAKALFDRGVPFVDVRGSSYYAGHIPGAVHLNRVGSFTEARLGKIVTKDQEVVIYCGGPTCLRSSDSCKEVVSWGYEKIYYFRDGFPGREAAGFPTQTAKYPQED